MAFKTSAATSRSRPCIVGLSVDRSRSGFTYPRNSEFGYWIPFYAGKRIEAGGVEWLRPLNGRENLRISEWNRRAESKNEREHERLARVSCCYDAP